MKNIRKTSMELRRGGMGIPLTGSIWFGIDENRGKRLKFSRKENKIPMCVR